MPRWAKPSEELPELECGDRVLVIIMERPRFGGHIAPRLIILEAVEDGWSCEDDTFNGYSPEDGVLWSLESDVCQIVHVLDIACSHCGGSGGGLEAWLMCPQCQGSGRSRP